ncbi:hypothetical protein DDZ18_10895 [Marinicauda salina]|uniref:Uncharacterized protein n=1 Tax=Marinicauda salina TaxID=2135793 RepID=A0A2U2BRU4_9PROT|nr:hypothetical protein [Marinicauda salina]PWE16709.1 hypothetical protein DDZ18_10895 [Marinicauda salina]
MTEADTERALREALAYALWRSPWRKELKSLDACRAAAGDLVRHMQRARFEVSERPPVEPHGGLARGAPDADR